MIEKVEAPITAMALMQMDFMNLLQLTYVDGWMIEASIVSPEVSMAERR